MPRRLRDDDLSPRAIGFLANALAGSEDFVPVRLVERNGELWAEPVFGKSNLIFTLAHADGMLGVPLDRAGLYAGDEVVVRLF